MYCYSTFLFHYYSYYSSTHRRYRDQTLWNLVVISYAMWSCAFKGWFFQNGCRCHGNGQNANKLKNKVQKMLNSLQTADPFETWHKNRSSLKVVLFVFKIFKKTANIKIKKIVENSKMKKFQWKWIFTGSKTCCTIWRPFRFAMVAILNPKWPPKYKNPPDLGKIWFPSTCRL